MRRAPGLAVLTMALIQAWLPPTVAAQTGSNVLVVANDAVPASGEIARYYVEKRNVPPEQLLTIRTATTDEITRAEFERSIRQPISAWFARNGAQDRILYIVLVKGVPLRIRGTAGRNGTTASVDSELTLLYRTMAGARPAVTGPVPNPFYAGETPLTGAKRFSHQAQDIFLVTRLDGFTVKDVIGLIDRGHAPARTGRIVLDQRASLNDEPDRWLATTEERLKAAGLGESVVLENTSRPAQADNVLAYASWGSNDPALALRRPPVAFANGALAVMFLSSDARTFTEPPVSWAPGPPRAGTPLFAGSTQNLTADLVAGGITGTAGYVAEPYVDGITRPNVVFPAYFAGFNLAESFYLGIPSLGWQTVVVGDPLCRPFAGAELDGASLNPPLDTDTELPTFFSARRLQGATADPRAARLVIRGETRFAKGDLPGAREALEQAVAVDDRVSSAWRTLAQIYEAQHETDKSIAVYRQLVERSPRDVVALNNLAYSLAVQKGNPADALQYAERANLLSPATGVFADTLGWIKHLMGDDAGALPLLVRAAKAEEEDADVRLHLAAVYAALGRLTEAAAELKAAASIDAEIVKRPEYAETLAKLKPGTP